MKHTLAISLLVLSLCAPGMAQTKPATGQSSTVTTAPVARPTTLQPTNVGDYPWSKGSYTTTLVIIEPPAPITIDGESAECTTPHLIKALKIAAAGLHDPNVRPVVFWSGGTSTLPYQYGQSYDSGTPAERLRAEADRLEAESKRVQWVRAVLAGCEK